MHENPAAPSGAPAAFQSRTAATYPQHGHLNRQFIRSVPNRRSPSAFHSISLISMTFIPPPAFLSVLTFVVRFDYTSLARFASSHHSNVKGFAMPKPRCTPPKLNPASALRERIEEIREVVLDPEEAELLSFLRPRDWPGLMRWTLDRLTRDQEPRRRP